MRMMMRMEVKRRKSDEASVTTPWGTFVLADCVSEESSFLGQRQFLLLSQELNRSDSRQK